jgi:LAO/AO transport system kinase
LPSLSESVLRGDRNAISRAISSVENEDANYRTLVSELYSHTGSAFIVGITGPPGTGKSSLVGLLVKKYREKGKRVAVLAVDPTSPISGGAILGDRVRMLEHSLDPDVYIRSMASRGSEGGLSRVSRNAVRILDAAGFDVIFVETVGIGQTEVDIVRIADVVVVVLMPELGDEIQAAKAGLMEIGDIFAVNKSDLPGADKVVYNLGTILSTNDAGWRQVALKVSAKRSSGTDDLVEALEKYRGSLGESKVYRARKRLVDELLEKVSEAIARDLSKRLSQDQEFDSLVEKLVRLQIDPDTAASEILSKYYLHFPSN